MPLSILERTVAGETDKRLSVLNHAIMRKMEWGSDWTEIRAFVRISTNRNSSWTSPPRFYMGLTSGYMSPPGSIVKHFFGVGNRSDRNWTNNTDYINMGTGIAIHKIINGNYTTVNANSVSGGDVTNCGKSSVMRSIWAVEIIKPPISDYSPSYSIRAASSGVSNMTLSDFQESVNNEVLTDMLPNNLIISTFRGHAIDEETNGYLDTFCFSWSGLTDAFEISDIAIRRLS